MRAILGCLAATAAAFLLSAAQAAGPDQVNPYDGGSAAQLLRHSSGHMHGWRRLRQMDAARAASWPKFYGLVGAYGVQSGDELRDMAKAGFRFAMLKYTVSRSPEVAANNILYLDSQLQFMMYTRCKADIAKTGSCSAATQSQILQSIKAYLAQHAAEPQAIGYWVLDDSPGGDIRPLLRGVHDLIAQSNRTSPFPRPAICAFNSASAVENFDPQGCDMVAIYLYARHSDAVAGKVDWALNTKLASLLADLRAKGWDPAQAPLIGMPQAFSYAGRDYVTPDAAAIATQSEAFCRAGAVALLAFSWHDGYAGQETELYNSPEMVRGLQQGMRNCQQKYWH